MKTLVQGLLKNNLATHQQPCKHLPPCLAKQNPRALPSVPLFSTLLRFPHWCENQMKVKIGSSQDMKHIAPHCALLAPSGSSSNQYPLFAPRCRCTAEPNAHDCCLPTAHSVAGLHPSGSCCLQPNLPPKPRVHPDSRCTGTPAWIISSSHSTGKGGGHGPGSPRSGRPRRYLQTSLATASNKNTLAWHLHAQHAMLGTSSTPWPCTCYMMAPAQSHVHMCVIYTSPERATGSETRG